jgi:DNA-binding NarL/FixJ family response regulator
MISSLILYAMWHLVIASLVLGVVAYRSGHMAEARSHLEQATRLLQTALELASKHGVQADFAQQVVALFPSQNKARAITVPETGQTLTPRETEVLHLLVDGASNRAIAEQLVISERTVKSHVSKISAKLSAPLRTKAAAKARAFL